MALVQKYSVYRSGEELHSIYNTINEMQFQKTLSANTFHKSMEF